MYIGVDLGSTNLKAALYDKNLTCIAQESAPVTYIREGGKIEFDVLSYFDTLLSMLKSLLNGGQAKNLRQIAFTGQAETLVCLDKDGMPIMNAISWMDERSTEECSILAAQFPESVCCRVTGQQAVLPTWPATKILWLRRNRPDLFSRVATYMLLKDYIVYRLTGLQRSDMSIATFSFYFDIYQKRYWSEMLDAIGISVSQLPELVEPCTAIGALLPPVAHTLGVSEDITVNTGTLDHFAGMIGTGNTTPGAMTLSMGTTMVLASVAGDLSNPDNGIAVHYGFIPNTYVLLSVLESGGVCLEWFRRTCLHDIDYDTLNQKIAACNSHNAPLFLPYLVGMNPPEFDREATGVFYGLRQEHTQYDMARAVLEGVSFTLRKNCEYITKSGTPISRITATGGGSKSAVWCQLQADITGVPVVVPSEKESACLGAAMIAACNDGQYENFADAAAACDKALQQYKPNLNVRSDARYQTFTALYQAMLEIAKGSK